MPCPPRARALRRHLPTLNSVMRPTGPLGEMNSSPCSDTEKYEEVKDIGK